MATKKKKKQSELEIEFHAAVKEVNALIAKGVKYIGQAEEAAEKHGITVSCGCNITDGIFGNYNIDKRWKDVPVEVIEKATGGTFEADWDEEKDEPHPTKGEWYFSSC